MVSYQAKGSFCRIDPRIMHADQTLNIVVTLEHAQWEVVNRSVISDFVPFCPVQICKYKLHCERDKFITATACFP